MRGVATAEAESTSYRSDGPACWSGRWSRWIAGLELVAGILPVGSYSVFLFVCMASMAAGGTVDRLLCLFCVMILGTCLVSLGGCAVLLQLRIIGYWPGRLGKPLVLSMVPGILVALYGLLFLTNLTDVPRYGLKSVSPEFCYLFLAPLLVAVHQSLAIMRPRIGR